LVQRHQTRAAEQKRDEHQQKSGTKYRRFEFVPALFWLSHRRNLNLIAEVNEAGCTLLQPASHLIRQKRFFEGFAAIASLINPVYLLPGNSLAQRIASGHIVALTTHPLG
jgi:hypothetical protein